ncbi:MAG: TMEM175 family protein [Candidatus Nanopelagicales bacterium]
MISSEATNPWTRTFYPRDGDGVGFDRVVFFSDAVFAIALTLMAVDIGIPEIEDPSSPSQLWSAIGQKGTLIAGFAVAFFWVAIYWRANHRFTNALSGMSARYIAVIVVYLGLVALLPFPAGMLGEYWQNPIAIIVFSAYAAMISTMEVVLFVVADRDGMFIAPISRKFRQLSILGSLTPVAAFVVAIPVAFVSTLAAIAAYVVVAGVLGMIVNKVFDTKELMKDPSSSS